MSTKTNGMSLLNGNNIQLSSLLKATTTSVREYLNKRCDIRYRGENYWLLLPENTKNKLCLVAHIDTSDPSMGWRGKYAGIYGDDYGTCGWDNTTVKKNNTLYYDKNEQVYWNPDGLGADDRAGVYACLKLFNETPEPYKPIILITDGEESGGYGAKEFASHHDKYEKLFSDVRYFLELDRANAADCCFYNQEPREFKQYIESFGFKEEHGTYTDISFICKIYKLCGANVSVGYYNQHTNYEFLRVKELNATINKVYKMLRDLNGKQWGLDVINHIRYSPWERKNNAITFPLSINNTQGIPVKCPKCGNYLRHMKNITKYYDEWYCANCFEPLQPEVKTENNNHDSLNETSICPYCSHEGWVNVQGCCTYCGRSPIDD